MRIVPAGAAVTRVRPSNNRWRRYMMKRLRIKVPQGAALRAVAGAAMLAAAGSATAFQLELANPDLKVRWDNTVRYNLGVRMEKQDQRILDATSYDESDAKFHKGQVVTNRFDLLSEMDVNYAGRLGARVSAAAWYDMAYDDHSVKSPGIFGRPGTPTSYISDTYHNKVTRYVNGPSAEFLDAF